MKKFLTGAAIAMAISQAFAAPDPNFHIYLAFGQSNMEGQGNIESQDKTVDKRFQVLWTTNETTCGKSLGQWSDAIPPLASCSGKLGPTDYFGRTMVEKIDSQIKVGVVVVAVAGCSIKLFDSPLDQGYMSQQASWFMQRVNAYGGKPYDRLIEMAKKAQEVGVIKGIIFHQGETDAGDGQWPSKVKKVYDRILKDLGIDDDIPFLAGEVLRSGVSKGANNNIAKLPQQSKNFYVISSEGLTQPLNDGQNVHFTSQEYRDLGKRYAEKMIEVLGDKINPVLPESSSSAAESSSSEPESSSSQIPSSSSHGITGLAQAQNVQDAILKTTKPGEFQLHLGHSEKVTVKVYTTLGKEVMDLSGNYAGTNSIILRGRLSAGHYVVSVQGDSFKAIKPVMVK